MTRERPGVKCLLNTTECEIIHIDQANFIKLVVLLMELEPMTNYTHSHPNKDPVICHSPI